MSDAVTVTTAWIANCDACGWHTPPSEPKSAVTDWARVHRIVCPYLPPAPPIRNGAVMSCGCWWHATPGAMVGGTTADCPLHGNAHVVKVNVDSSGEGPWVRTPSPEPTEGGR